MEKKAPFTLLLSVFIISLCGLGYELLAGTVTSYFLGNSVLQFSLTIGIFLFAMGVGSWISGKVEDRLVEIFLLAEILIALFGGFFSFVMFSLYTYAQSAFYFWFFLLLFVTGALIGLEIPLLIRMVRSYGTLKIAVAHVLSFDYLGALAASILFPLVLLPSLGLMQASFFYGLLNMVVAFLFLNLFKEEIRFRGALFVFSIAVTLVLLAGLFSSLRLTTFFETRMYADEIILTRQTKYQRIVMTRFRDDVRLFLDGNLQFCSLDEYRYHEVLVHPALLLAPRRGNVLILGGGDGLGAREVLKYSDVESVVLVDLDAEMVGLSRTNPLIVGLNGGALSDSRVKTIIGDGFKFLETADSLYDAILVDLPDPNNESLAKLYTVQFYKLAARHLARGGVLCTQATSPFFARRTFWCINRTVAAAGLKTVPMRVNVPSFGEWGFVLASAMGLRPGEAVLRVPTRYLTNAELRGVFSLPADFAAVPAEANTLDNPVILKYYLSDWKRWE